MTVSWDFNTATLVAIALQVVLLIVFLTRTNIRANAAYDLAEKAGEQTEALDQRLRKVEAEHVLGMALRQDFKDFQNSIGNKLDDLRSERRQDMNGLHTRLNEIMMLPDRPVE